MCMYVHMYMCLYIHVCVTEKIKRGHWISWARMAGEGVVQYECWELNQGLLEEL